MESVKRDDEVGGVERANLQPARSVVACLGLGVLVAVVLAGCSLYAAEDGQVGLEPGPPEPASVTILHVNDVYRIEGVDRGRSGGIARIRTLRAELERQGDEVLMLHAGDLLFPSLLSQTYNGAQMIDALNLLDGERTRTGAGAEADGCRDGDGRMVAAFGNHEFDEDGLEDAALVDRRVEDSEFCWLDTNIEWERGVDGEPLVQAANLLPRYLREVNGVTVGIFTLATDFKHPDYVDYFGNTLDAAECATLRLRADGADVVIGLTHLRMSQDEEILETLGADGPDLILGGHEHAAQAKEIGGRWVLKADAEARTAWVVRISVRPDGAVHVARELRCLDEEHGVAPDPEVQAVVDEWLEWHDRGYCAGKLNLPFGCLDEGLATAGVTLVAAEDEIRRYETNLGDWVADLALSAFEGRGAQAAFINSGSLRLNQDIAAGATITRRYVEELFPYPADLVVLEIDGRTLQEVVSHAVEDWSGNGWWLQVAGIRFRHDPATESATELMLVTDDGPRPVEADEKILVVTSEFLAEGNDGYEMLEPEQIQPDMPEVDLKDLVLQALAEAEEKGERIAVHTDGRIRNDQPRAAASLQCRR